MPGAAGNPLHTAATAGQPVESALQIAKHSGGHIASTHHLELEHVAVNALGLFALLRQHALHLQPGPGAVFDAGLRTAVVRRRLVQLAHTLDGGVIHAIKTDTERGAGVGERLAHYGLAGAEPVVQLAERALHCGGVRWRHDFFSAGQYLTERREMNAVRSRAR